MTAQPYVAACSLESYDTLSRWSSWNCTVNCHFLLVCGCIPRKSDDSTWNLIVDLLGSGATTRNSAPDMAHRPRCHPNAAPTCRESHPSGAGSKTLGPR